MSKSLWQPPHLLSDDEENERRASLLELFYDLIFVVAIASSPIKLLISHLTYSTTTHTSITVSISEQ